MPDTRADVLVVGWRPRAIAALLRHGARVTCLLTPEDRGTAEETGSAAELLVVPDPTSTQENLAALARAGYRPADFSAICSEEEFTLLPAGILATIGGCSGTGHEIALALRDKYVQKRLIRDAGLPVAGCQLADDLRTAAVTEFPAVLKPVAGAATRETFLIESPAALSEVAGRVEHRGPWLIEEYVAGREFHVDGVVRDGSVVGMGLGRYLANVMDVLHTRGLMASTGVSETEQPLLHKKARALTEAALRALGYTDGVFHLEAFLAEDELIFGECAGRVAGGLIRDVTLHQFGVDLDEEWARAVLGLPAAGPRVQDADAAFGWLFLSAPPGRLTRLPDSDAVQARPGVTEVKLDVSLGGQMPDMRAATNIRAGRVLLRGHSEADVTAKIRGLDQWFRDHVQVRPGADNEEDLA